MLIATVPLAQIPTNNGQTEGSIWPLLCNLKLYKKYYETFYEFIKSSLHRGQHKCSSCALLTTMIAPLENTSCWPFQRGQTVKRQNNCSASPPETDCGLLLRHSAAYSFPLLGGQLLLSHLTHNTSCFSPCGSVAVHCPPTWAYNLQTQSYLPFIAMCNRALGMNFIFILPG